MPTKKRKSSPFALTLLLASLTAFGPFSTDMYLSSFPELAKSFATDAGTVQLSLSSFFLGLTLGQLFYGPLIDRFGRKRPLLAGIFLFTLASFCIVFVPSIWGFNGLRFVQALGGAAGMVVSRAVIRDLYQGREAARVLSLMMMVQGIAPVVAPTLGGTILTLAPWEAEFAFLVVYGLICLGATKKLLPETLPEEERSRTKPTRILKIFLALMKRKAFAIPALSSGLTLSSIFAFISGSPFVFMELHGLDQEHYTALFTLNAAGLIITSQINRILLKRWEPKQVLLGALIFNGTMGVTFLCLAQAKSLWLVVPPLYLGLSTIPLIAANCTAIAMEESGRNAGSASSLLGVLQFAFASLASALIGLFHNGTAYPMAGWICAAGLGALFLTAREGKREKDAAAAAR